MALSLTKIHGDSIMLIAGYDIETTGLDVAEDRICELALIMRDTDTSKDVLSYVRRVNPEKRISPKASKIHGIMDGDLVGAPLFKNIAPLLVKIFDRVDIIVGHNLISFDMPLTVHELIRCGVTLSSNAKIFDTMANGRWATSDGKFPTLKELCWSLDVEYDTNDAHQAEYDVRKTLECFQRGVNLDLFLI